MSVQPFIKHLGILLLISTGIACLPVAGQAQNTTLQWYSMKEAQEKADLHKKEVLIFAEAAWCVYCKQMDREAFRDPDIIKEIEQYFYPVRVNIESDRPMVFNGTWITESQFAEKYELHVPPKTLVLDAAGRELFSYSGYISEAAFNQILSLWHDAKAQ